MQFVKNFKKLKFIKSIHDLSLSLGSSLVSVFIISLFLAISIIFIREKFFQNYNILNLSNLSNLSGDKKIKDENYIDVKSESGNINDLNKYGIESLRLENYTVLLKNIGGIGSDINIGYAKMWDQGYEEYLPETDFYASFSQGRFRGNVNLLCKSGYTLSDLYINGVLKKVETGESFTFELPLNTNTTFIFDCVDKDYKNKIIYEKKIENMDPFKTVEVKILSGWCNEGGMLVKCDDVTRKVLDKSALTIYQDFQKDFEVDENYMPLEYNSKTEMYVSKIDETEYFSEVTKLRYYTGGAHGHSTLIANNYKTKQDYISGENKIKDLESLFGSDVYKKIADKLKLELKDRIVFEEGAQAKKENFNIWYIKDNKLNVYISEYQAAPYAFGEYVLSMDLSELK
jgi:hypothetical protein